MGILEGKRILVAGVTMDSLDRLRDGQGRPGAGRDRADLQLRAGARHHPADRQRLPHEPPVLELDVTDDDHLAGLADAGARARRRPRRRRALDRLRQPGDDPRRQVPRRPVGRTSAQAVQVSAYSFKSLAAACLPLMAPGRLARRADLRRDRRLAGVRLDGRRQGRARVVHPLPRPRPRPAGHPRPTWSRPARSRRWPPRRSPASRTSRSMWSDRAPLGWDLTDHEPTARAVVRAALRLLPDHHRRDRARRRRLPRHGGLTGHAARFGSVRA